MPSEPITLNGSTTGLTLCCALDDAANDEILYLPEGSHTISATLDGEPKKVKVTVDEEAAERLQTSLKERLSQNVRPHFDFDHAGNGPASARPTSFRWGTHKGKDGKERVGVLVTANWTEGGKASIRGGDYAHFSPVVVLDSDGKPSRLPATGPIGALVNEPAFRDMPALAASHNKTTKTKMNLTKFVQAGLLSAAEAESPETAVSILLDVHKKQAAELEAASTARDNALAELQKNLETEVDATLDRLVSAGVAALSDDTQRETWRAIGVNNGVSALQVLEASAPNPLATPILPGTGPAQLEDPQTAETQSAKILEAANAITKSEGIPFSVAWKRAESTI